MKLSVVLFLLAPLLVSCEEDDLPVDCNAIHKLDNKQPSGVYTIYPSGATSAIQVYCDMDSVGGRWTVFQRRMDGSVNFYRPWVEYKRGFGIATGEYWLGLDNLHELTRLENYELMVDIEDFEGNTRFARYSSFKVDNACEGYRLIVSGFNNTGGAGDSLSYHNGQKFSTFDKDQDSSSVSCARTYLGAFWYNNCHHTNPNGFYHRGAHDSFIGSGVQWYHWMKNDYSLKGIGMKIRPFK